MIDFATLQKILKKDLEVDRAANVVEVSAPTLEAAVAEAAALLNIPFFRIEYEVNYRGFSGFLGAGKTDWRILAYERALAKKKKSKARVSGGAYFVEAADRDGDFFVQMRTAGAFLKAAPPEGEGKKPQAQAAFLYLQERGAFDIDSDLVQKVIEESKGEYIRVGGFNYDLMNSTSVKFESEPGGMKAYMTVTRPGKGGCDLTALEYVQLCKQNKIYSGIKEDFIKGFADKPLYAEKVEIAEGTQAVDGRDAYIQYNFNTGSGKAKLKEHSDGKIDFRELNIIKNVVKNQVLARKIPPEAGIPGKTVSGAFLPASNGKDIVLLAGNNAVLNEAGDTILAGIDGQVLLINDIIAVEPVYTVDGDVNLSTGNIDFLGNVRIKGNVEDGFTVKAAGNIEVGGLVSKARLEAGGDIIISQGVNGKGAGGIKAGKSVYAKFFENAIVSAGMSVVADESIVNSQVDAAGRISCRGKKAAVVGGHLRAREGISAKTIGSATSGAETVCEVGFDPAGQRELSALLDAKMEMAKELEEVKLEIQSLSSAKKLRKSLPADKEARLQGYMERRHLLMADIKKNEGRIGALKEYLSALKSGGFVSASADVFAGTVVIIRNIREIVTGEYKAVTFYLEDELVKVKPYHENDEGNL